MLFDQMTYLEEGSTHLYADGLCFIASRNGAAVIVRQNNDGFSLQVGSEDPLAGSEEVVAVGKCKHDSTSSLLPR